MNAQTPVRVVHLSDLHFGREDTAVVNALHERLAALDPLVIAISGDLTQRARRHQFRRARSFLDALPAPYLAVPGNHDVPLFNLFARLLDPLGGYHRHISTDTAPVYAHPRVLIVGMNTTRPSSLKDARISTSAVAHVSEAVGRVKGDVVKILVAHHPFGAHGPEASGADDGAADPLRTLAEAGVDVFLTGHLHVSAASHSASRYRLGGRSALLVEAGTATSTRLREATNAFNVLHVTIGAITVERHDWGPSGFQVADTQRFVRTAAGWSDQIE